MYLTKKEKLKLRKYFFNAGHGSKTVLARVLDMHNSQVTLMANSGYCPDEKYNKLMEHIGSQVKPINLEDNN